MGRFSLDSPPVDPRDDEHEALRRKLNISA
jgi:hypothetical protein